ncbi:hypothetical protein F5148DRAFT_1258736 [Russula earlei]|uniref:Uncharacterized protein n=1 Tax=Russula earlei TaxID=71964 RepID=A0ACC0TSB8_9AGAM|nr:hypothetical protein F5148DRAFT_1258736 [Russula earlei]
MSDADPSVNRIGPSSSGLTLVLPSLKALKELNAKNKNSSPLLEPTAVKKNPRPIKLKPLKEVLRSLITKIKKKDDYAFFLKPVDTEKVPGYLDAIARPMDFGTMTEKVTKSKYRSLDEFADDFRLVISNAKTFNPSGTIYYTEAERIEAWASDHISKAASYVIEYETDWNIEIDRDEDVNVDADEDAATGLPSAGPDTPARRSPSVVSTSAPPPNRRGKNALKREGISETLEPDGHLPGFKDGVGVFPPGSDWAEVMLALKLKGKRYRSKKERLRMEKGGPPYATDGSLDYAEMEEPFSVLSALVPDQFCAPLVDPLFAPPSQDSSQINLPMPISVLPSRNLPTTPAPRSEPTDSSKSKYQHWTIARPALQRGRTKEVVEERPSTPEWRKPRPLHATDYGLFPSFASDLSPGGTPVVLPTQERLFEAIYSNLEDAVRTETPINPTASTQNWLREVVYGGFDGMAYMRSVAEFVTKNTDAPDRCPNGALVEYVDAVLIDELTERRHRTIEAALGGFSDLDQNLPVTSPSSEIPVVHPTQPQLDLGSLISAPNELFDAENAWAGAGANEDSTMLSRALDHASHLLEQLQARRMEAGAAGMNVESEMNAVNERDLETELRMNLIALAKRAPIDQIAKMPSELVPPHLRHIIPTIGC